ncbi:LacI family DNA-binding transcriptional regulator [Chloroflexota bacterium]
MAVTMHDVARLAGVSQSTVSRVLNHDPETLALSADTIARVQTAANDLGYRMDPLARAMKGKATQMIGITVRRYDLFLTWLVSELTVRFRSAGYTTIQSSAENIPSETLRLHNVFETAFCDGLVLAADPEGLDEALFASLRKKHLVMTAWGEPIPGIPLINTDNHLGTRLMMNHLFELGHKRIAFLDVGWSGDHYQRQVIYETMMKEAGLYREAYFLVTGEGFEAGMQAAQILMALEEPPTAIFASEDRLAIGVIKAAHEMGIAIPKELSVVGFDGLPVASYCYPTLTTIRQPVERIADAVVELLDDLIFNRVINDARYDTIWVPPTFVQGASSAPPRRS